MTAEVTVEHGGTVYSDEPVYDAQTDATTTELVLAIPATHHYTEAGYDAAGSLIFNQYATDPAGDPITESVDGARTVTVRNDQFALYDAAGQLLDVSETGGFPTLNETLGEPVTETLNVTEGLVINEQLQAPAGASAFGVDAGARVERTGDVLRVYSGSMQASASSVRGSAAPAAGGKPVKQTKKYRRQGDQYVLEEVTTETETAVEGGRVRGRSVMRFRNVHWKNNETKDRARRDRRGAGTGSAGAGGGPRPLDEAGLTPEDDCQYTIDNTACEGGGGSGGPVASEVCSPVPDGVNVVFQHGINSDAGTWGGIGRGAGVRSYLRCSLAINDEVLYPMPDKGHGSHVSQAALLRNEVAARGRAQYVFVGHSQGGLISRRVAQGLYAEGRSNLVRGVISVGTPHLGANVARNFPAMGRFGVTATFLADPVLCVIMRGKCDYVYDLLVSGINFQLGASSGTFAGADLVPGSPAIRQVNGVAEAFPRYGVQHYVSKRWAFARVAGDASGLKGRKAVTILDVTAGVSTGGAIISAICGKWGLSAILASGVRDMIRTDAYYHRITAGPDRTDGVVEGRSQVYPNALLNVQAQRPTSHPGETKSEGSADEIRTIMTRRLGVSPLTR